jgi:pimeloyl-ACP methyl ester carboxylesterase
MQPLTFGRSAQPLFGLYQAPTGSPPRRRGVVLCHAIGPEYLPAYPSMKQLAAELARARFPVLRFDWFGSGDSAGETGEGDLLQWQNDLETAIDELKDTAQVSEVSIVGLRLGASIAAMVAKDRSDVDRLLLWEPVVEGVHHLEEMNALQDSYLDQVLPRPVDALQHGARREIVGFPMSEELTNTLRGLDLMTLSGRLPDAVLVLDRVEDRSHRRFAEHLKALARTVEYCSIGAPRIWVKAASEDDVLVHRETLNAIVGWLEREG